MKTRIFARSLLQNIIVMRLILSIEISMSRDPKNMEKGEKTQKKWKSNVSLRQGFSLAENSQPPLRKKLSLVLNLVYFISYEDSEIVLCSSEIVPVVLSALLTWVSTPFYIHSEAAIFDVMGANGHRNHKYIRLKILIPWTGNACEMLKYTNVYITSVAELSIAY